MPTYHALELIKSNKEARAGFFVSIFLIVIMMGWMSVAYARTNIYLMLISFPMFNAIFIVSITLFLIRAENQNLTKLLTIPSGIKKVITGNLAFSIVAVLTMNAIFEILAVLLREFLMDIYADLVLPIDYTPNMLILILFLGCNLSFYCCFASFAAWLFSQSDVIPAKPGEILAKLEGYISGRFILVLALLVLASILLAFTLQSAIGLTEVSILFEPMIWSILAIGFNSLLSSILWTFTWKSLNK